jgi:hypothetical protein
MLSEQDFPDRTVVLREISTRERSEKSLFSREIFGCIGVRSDLKRQLAQFSDQSGFGSLQQTLQQRHISSGIPSEWTGVLRKFDGIVDGLINILCRYTYVACVVHIMPMKGRNLNKRGGI